VSVPSDSPQHIQQHRTLRYQAVLLTFCPLYEDLHSVAVYIPQFQVYNRTHSQAGTVYSKQNGFVFFICYGIKQPCDFLLSQNFWKLGWLFWTRNVKEELFPSQYLFVIEFQRIFRLCILFSFRLSFAQLSRYRFTSSVDSPFQEPADKPSVLPGRP
jgi:hypothetical protein